MYDGRVGARHRAVDYGEGQEHQGLPGDELEQPYASGARRDSGAYVGEGHGEYQRSRHLRGAAVDQVEVERVPDDEEEAALEEPDRHREGEQHQHGGGGFAGPPARV